MASQYRNPKRLHLEAQTGLAAIGELAVQTEDWPTDPYAFIGAVNELSRDLFPPPTIESDGPLPALEPGGVVIELARIEAASKGE